MSQSIVQSRRRPHHERVIREKGEKRAIRLRGLVAAFQETRDEILRQPGTGVFFWAEVLHDVGKLLPEVEGFLWNVSMQFWTSGC